MPTRIRCFLFTGAVVLACFGCDKPPKNPIPNDAQQYVRVAFRYQDGTPIRLVNSELQLEGGYYPLKHVRAFYNDRENYIESENATSDVYVDSIEGKLTLMKDGRPLGILDVDGVDEANLTPKSLGWSVYFAPGRLEYVVYK